jgi:hypothetical protein
VELDDERIACVVRQDDGAFVPLRDMTLLLDLKASDADAYALLLGVARKFLDAAMLDGIDA